MPAKNGTVAGRVWKRYGILLLFTAPALIFYIVFVIVPLVGGAFYSFTDWNGLNRKFSLVGLKNYLGLFSDGDFIHSVGFTMKYVLFMVILQNVAAIFLAVMIESRRRTKGLFRTVFFMPNMMSLIVSGLMWEFIFLKVTEQLAGFTGLKILDQSWTGDPKVSFYSIVLVSLWAGVGYMMVIYMAAIQGIPQDVKEAALLDGAGPFRNFYHITLPMIMNAVSICLFLTLNNAVKVYDVVYALTRGGPGRATEVLSINIYFEAFSNNNKYGYASAKAIVMFLIAAVIAVIQLGITKRKEVKM